MQASGAGKTSRVRTAVLALCSALVALGLFVIVAEAALRLLPVASGLRTQGVNQANPVFHMAPNRDYVYSRDWDLAMVNRGRINNAGFANDQDYVRDGPPLLAVIGDSYIEALMVPYAETLQGRLAKALAGKARVYSFGASGAPLSQYLVWARNAVREYGAAALLINVVGNDFDESLADYRVAQGFWLYAAKPDGGLKLELVDYRPGILRAAAGYSAFMRYAFFNLRVQDAPQNLAAAANGLFARLHAGADPERTADAAAQPQYAGNTAAAADEARMKKSLAVIDAFFADLPVMTGLPADRIVFTLDGFRYPEAASGAAGSYFDVMRREFMARAGARGYEAIDLDPAFFARHRATGERFDFPPRDGHWNANGHAVAAGEALKSRVVQSIGR